MEPDEEDPEFRRFMQLDVKLRLLEKWPDIRKEFDVVREEYPDSYKFVLVDTWLDGVRNLRNYCAHNSMVVGMTSSVVLRDLADDVATLPKIIR